MPIQHNICNLFNMSKGGAVAVYDLGDLCINLSVSSTGLLWWRIHFKKLYTLRITDIEEIISNISSSNQTHIKDSLFCLIQYPFEL